jgi:hypothetical protein
MGTIFCPACEKQTVTRPWDFIPWLGHPRQVFWCRTCHQWFAFSDSARRLAFWGSIAALVLPAASVRLYFEVSGVHRITGWGFWAFIAIVLLGYNVASAFILSRKARLVGPIDYAP